MISRKRAGPQIVACAEAINARDGRWLMTAGLVPMRQKPGSAKGVMFITIEDETGPYNIVVWPSLFEKRRPVVLGASMIAINGRIQREGGVVHLVAWDFQRRSVLVDILGVVTVKAVALRRDDLTGAGGEEAAFRVFQHAAFDLVPGYEFLGEQLSAYLAGASERMTSCCRSWTNCDQLCLVMPRYRSGGIKISCRLVPPGA